MRCWSVACVLMLVLLLPSSPIRAQFSGLPGQESLAPPPPPAAVVDGAVVPLQAPAGVEDPGSPWTIDFLLGVPLGMRIQRAVGPNPEGPLLLEGFAGLYLIFPTLGVGARMQWVPLRGKHESLVISPGVGAYLMYVGVFNGWLHSNSSAPDLLVADVDIAWHHSYARGGDGQIGLKLGAGAVIGCGNGFVPLVALFAGWRF